MEKTGARLYAGDALICMIPARENCCDSLEEIGEGAWKWVRKTALIFAVNYSQSIKEPR